MCIHMCVREGVYTYVRGPDAHSLAPKSPYVCECVEESACACERE